MNRPADPKPTNVAVSQEAEAAGILTVDLAAIAENYRTLVRRATPSECGAVVKADAYGCGIGEVTTALYKAGCKTFFVATLAEARRVRGIASEAAIYVLDGFFPGTGPSFAATYARPVIGSVAELGEWDTFCAQVNWRGGAALHIDTGMNRLGVTPDEAMGLSARMQTEQHGLTLLMSHLVCADSPEHPMNDKQIRLFREMRRLFRGIPASLANSSGIFLGPSAHGDLVRPGAALFGVNPVPGRPNPMRPVIELKGRIAQIRIVARGESVGYGAAWTAKRPSRIAIVAVGYADGYLRAASVVDQASGGHVEIAGKACPLAGRVSMDLMAVDVTDLPDGAAQRGHLVTLIGEKIGVDQVAAFCKTIGYEILTGLGRRHHRVYRGA